MYNGKRTVSLISGVGKTGPFKRMKLDHFNSPYTQIVSKWIKDLNIRPETIKVLKENISSKLFHVGLRNTFLDLPPRQGQ